MKGFISCAVLPLVLLAGALRTTGSDRAIDEERAAALHRDFTFETFGEYRDASAEIAFEAIDYPLLAAAVFHETNRRRAQHNLSVLRYRPQLQEAARIQAQGMKRSGTVSHQHPDEKWETLSDRLEHVGLRPAFGAENVAMTFGIRYEAGRPVLRHEENGTTVFRYESDSEPIQPHTYLSFAESLVKQWMNSPGHRRNILSKEPEELGAGLVHDRNDQGMDVFYSAQVFFAELDIPPGAQIIEEPDEP